MRLPLDANDERELVRFVVRFGLTIVTWASVHDLHLISIEPRHFTEFHRPLLPISHPALLAIQYATVATLGPAMLFGGLTFVVCRLGAPHRISLRRAWCAFLPVIALIETTALAAGQLALARHLAGEPMPFPESLYPDSTAGIAYSQTVNITAYLAATGFGIAFLVTLGAWRWRWRHRMRSTP